MHLIFNLYQLIKKSFSFSQKQKGLPRSEPKVLLRGFTLVEVLVSIGMLGGMILTVSYMNVANLAEIRRHTAEFYADLIAQQQFSALVAYRNQNAFDKNSSTNWNTILNLAPSDPSVYSGNYYFTKNSSNLWLPISSSAPMVSKVLNDKGAVMDFIYFLRFQRIRKTTGSAATEPNMIKVNLQVSWKDRGQTKIKDYYTILGNYL